MRSYDYLRGLLASEFPNCETPPAQIDASQGDWVAEAMARMEGMKISAIVGESVTALAEIWPKDMHHREHLESKGVKVGGKRPANNLVAHITRFPDLIKRTSWGRYAYKRPEGVLDSR